MKTPFKNEVYLFISALGLFIGGIGISLVHGVDHPNPDNTRTPAEQAARRSMGRTLTWTGLAMSVGGAAVMLMRASRNSENKA